VSFAIPGPIKILLDQWKAPTTPTRLDTVGNHYRPVRHRPQPSFRARARRRSLPPDWLVPCNPPWIDDP
jgi:hypothetical protein